MKKCAEVGSGPELLPRSNLAFVFLRGLTNVSQMGKSNPSKLDGRMSREGTLL